MPRSRPLAERLWSQAKRTGDCWVWIGTKDHKGYGRISAGGRAGRKLAAHRVAYELTIGPIPEDMVIDHKCRNRCCVNPSHLQLANQVTNNQNRSGAHKDSRTGIRGVTFDRRYGHFAVTATVDGRRHYGGSFRTLSEAEEAAINLRNRVMTNNLADRECSQSAVAAVADAREGRRLGHAHTEGVSR